MINLKKLQITNFKGLKNLTLEFPNHITNIYGANETGKTSTYDAFLWLLFGKDSTDRADFNIRPLDKENNPNNRVETEVSALLVIDGLDVSLKRVFKPKWVKERGALEAEYKGNETVYFYNDVPLKQADYKGKIDAIIDEKLFKLLTNPLYFNNNLKWQDRRSMLIKMADEISDKSILQTLDEQQYHAQVEELTKNLNANKSISEYKAEISAKKKKIKDELAIIPARIDEANKMMPADIPVYSEVEAKIAEIRKEIENIDNEIQNSNIAVNNQRALVNEALKKKSDLEVLLAQEKSKRLYASDETKNTIKSKIQALKFQISNTEAEIKNINTELSRNNSIINTNADRMDKLRSQWKEENEKQLIIDETNFSCPTCKRELPADDIEAKSFEISNHFNNAKAEKLKSIERLGSDLKEHNEICNKSNTELTVRMNLVKESLDVMNTVTLHALERDLANLDQTESSTPSVAELEIRAKIDAIVIPTIEQPDNSELKRKQSEMHTEIEQLNKKLSVRSVVYQVQNRIEELEAQQKTMATSLLNLEKQEFVIDGFNKRKMTLIEKSINEKFKYVSFKMFETAISGGESECCETLHDGVPFSDKNTAGKILCGIDIINTFSKRYNVYAPIFLDNRESVTDIPETESQIINLIVSPEDKVLRVV